MHVLQRWPVAVLIGVEMAGFLSASEQLYYHGAPVAHVVAYETRLRDERLQQQLARISARRS